ncbi:presqualene diphosphate synthase HpnD [Methylocapsa sp. D3K7]|uniref:presqualene diphosphate synthase HpnD n=1 Tax=Methylocapsa sp. D3K7 TaxID=3041435 RepID=UPI00244E806E|nr:presqualene diphosphate synthase HpnD [Methylocapsa sp. D3K7]WGJ16168.1 presqualene diphosphate synthase HpnD [Methylocapsa sp. D3K7]
MNGASEAAVPADASTSARGSSFNAAMRILPRPRREAMFEIYSFCRAVDDIADEAGPRPARKQALAQWRRDIDSLYARGEPIKPSLRGLGEAIHAFGLRREDFCAVIDGMEMDVETDIRAPDLATLDLYCDRVASAVGRLSARAFGMPEAEGDNLAHHLGRALQLTNILRDLDEDAAIGRLYLPREDLCVAGISVEEPRAVLADSALGRACAPTLARAKAHFAEAARIMARCPRRSVRAPRIMADVYRAILDRLEQRGFAVPRSRVRTPRHRVLLAILRYGLV